MLPNTSHNNHVPDIYFIYPTNFTYSAYPNQFSFFYPPEFKIFVSREENVGSLELVPKEEDKQPPVSVTEKPVQSSVHKDEIYVKEYIGEMDKKFEKNSVSSCNCIRTKCIKYYCPCFKKGYHCSNNCRCVKCRNVYKKRLLEAKPIKCSCLKSKCSSKYCDCLSAGRKCTYDCGCTGCMNTPSQ